MAELGVKYFASLGEFAAYARRLDLIKIVADMQGRSVIAKDLKTMVRDRIGKPELLPPPLADDTVADRVAKGYSPNETLLRTGELQRSIGWEHTSPLVTVVGSRDKKSVYHELGTPRIPRRSFLASTASENNEKLFAMYLAAFVSRFSHGRSATISMVEADD